MRLVLASGSATRAALLREAGIAFTIHPATVDEPGLREACRAAGASPGEAALRLAEAKAIEVRAHHPDAAILGADQILSLDGEWFEKPADLAATREHLRRLRGRRHVLHTAAVLLGAGEAWHHLAEPALTMRALPDAEIDAYVAEEGAALLTSVGAYRIEGGGSALFAAIEGESATIRGLPMQALRLVLAARTRPPLDPSEGPWL